MGPDLWWDFVLFVLSLSCILVGALLTLVQRMRERRVQQSTIQAQQAGYYCYGCEAATYAPLRECWYRTGHANVLAPLCLVCQSRFHAIPISQRDVRGIGTAGPRMQPLPTSRSASSLKW